MLKIREDNILSCETPALIVLIGEVETLTTLCVFEN